MKVTCQECGGQGWVNDRSPQYRSPPVAFRPKKCGSCGGVGEVEVEGFGDAKEAAEMEAKLAELEHSVAVSKANARRWKGSSLPS